MGVLVLALIKGGIVGAKRLLLGLLLKAFAVFLVDTKVI